MLKDRKILIGVTGGIAAYKTAYLVRLLKSNNAQVKVVMTPSAKEFITPLTLSTLSKNPVYSDFFIKENGWWNSHVELGTWADLFVIAPCSANTLAKIANGICDNLLLTTAMSIRCPLVLAPAMDCDMYNHPATSENIEKLRKRKVEIIEPAKGELASGLEGKGRMEEPDKILQKIISLLNPQKKL